MKTLALMIAASVLVGGTIDGMSAEKKKKTKRKPNPAMAPIKDVKGLPRVLLIGDSISIGYTVPTREFLKDKANVHRIPVNGGPTPSGLKSIDSWLGKGKWDVIHFNFGLHDIKHVKPDTGKNSNDPADPQQADLEQYRNNLTSIVEALKATKGRLVFATTTPYPDTVSKPLRSPGMPERYNQAALSIMKRNGISVNNLHDFVVPRMAILQRPDNVHFTDTGYEALAEQVVTAIRAVLPAK